MNLKEAFLTALSSICSNKIRNLLSMFGIVIGISFVVVIMSLGGTFRIIVEELLTGEAGGVSVVDVFISANKQFEEIDQFAIEGFMQEYENIAYDVLVESPSQMTGSVMNDDISYSNTSSNNVKSAATTVKGVSKGYEFYNSINMINGRFINNTDCDRMTSSIVISDITAKAVFNSTDCLGKSIRLMTNDMTEQQFVVVGVYKYVNKTSGNSKSNISNINTMSFAAYSYINNMNNLDLRENVWNIYIRIVPVDEKYFHAVAFAASDYFKNIYDNEYNVMVVPFVDEVQSGVKTLPTLVTVAFLIIAMICLVVGGIGVMNINLISVTEKTKEIGIYKALGATNGYIAMQFLLESVIICIIAGIIGILVGIGMDAIIQTVLPTVIDRMPNSMEGVKVLLSGLNLRVEPSIFAVVVAFIITTCTGVIFGTLPAAKAAKMNVVDSLRYE